MKDVELLIENERWQSAVNRIYYSMFYMLMALSVKYKFETSKHQQLIGWFNKTFVKEQIINSKYSKFIKKAYEYRTRGDYNDFIEFEKSDVLQMFEDMNEFIYEIEKFINKE
ncbi:MAG: HEPN domain-containing protein [Bacteroidetes bacterium]|nr:HEPN domain-containing protein [Bacteroidota bacterium]